MEDLAKFIEEINDSAKYYDIKYFQSIRKQIHPGARGNDIFPSKPKHVVKDEGYVYHLGGRAELQLNIGLDKDSGEFRYGIAFALKEDRYLHDPLNLLKPKINRLNQYLREHLNEFEDMQFWAYDEIEGATIVGPKKVEPIAKNANLIRNNVFLFWGKFALWKETKADDVLLLFDRLLPVYEYVEGYTTHVKQVKGLKFKLGNNLERMQVRSKRETRKINLRHNVLVRTLHSILKRLGKDAGNANTNLLAKIDMIESTEDALVYYEVKTSDDIKLCIREALGQLLEYSYWPGGREAKSLIIITENQMTVKARQRLDVKSKTLED
jgi:hypothetical protein